MTFAISILKFFFQKKFFGFLKSVAEAALKCPKPLFSISLFKRSSALTIEKTSYLKNNLFFDREVRF